MRQFSLFVGALACLASCRPQTERKAATPRPVTAGIDLQAVIDRARLAFREVHGGFAAAHSTHQVTVDGEGTISLECRPALRAEALRLQTKSLGVPTSIVAEPDGSLRVERAGSVERLINTEKGLEQAWTFARVPEGTESLRIEVAVHGLEFTGSTAEGLHFRGETGSFRYGTAKWIDASGLDRALPEPSFELGKILLEVPEETLAASRCPCTLDPLISPEFAVDNPVMVSGIEGANYPTVAFDGTNFLVVRVGSQGQILATRVTLTGQVLDPTGFEVRAADPAYSAAQDTAVAFDGNNYLVVWSERVNYYWGVYGKRIRTDGTLLDSSPIVISSTFDDRTADALASNGASFLVAIRRSGLQNLETVRVASDGTVLDATPLLLSQNDLHFGHASVVSNGSDYLVAWGRQLGTGAQTDVVAVRVNAAGALLDSPAIQIATGTADQHHVSISFGNGSYLAVWEEGPDPVYGNDLKARRIAQDGTLPDPAATTVTHALGDEKSPSTAFDGTNFLVAYRAGNSTSSALPLVRIKSDGTLLDTTPAILSYSIDSLDGIPVARFGGGTYLVAWLANQQLMAARVATDRTVLDPGGLVLSKNATTQVRPVVAASSSRYLVTWTEYANGGALYASRLDDSGAILDPAGIKLADLQNYYSGPPDMTRNASVASDGQDFLVVFTDAQVVYGVRVSAAGAVQQGKFRLSPQNEIGVYGEVAWGGGEYLVAYLMGGYIAVAGPRATRVLPNGTVLDPSGIDLGIHGGDGVTSAVGWDGNHFLVVVFDSGQTVRLVRLTPGGTVLDTGGYVLSGVTGGYPCLAFDGVHLLLGLQQESSNCPPVLNVAVRLNPDLTLADPAPFPVSASSTQCTTIRPSLTYDGSTFVMVWPDPQGPLRAARIRPDGALLDHDGFVVDSSTQMSLPQVASSGNGRSLVVSARRDDAQPFRAVRVRARLLTVVHGQANGVRCYDDSECASGNCVDDVCCDTACGKSDPGDCQACSVAAGALVDGTCTILPSTYVCRAVAGLCDVAESCDGAQPACAADGFLAAGTLCRPSIGVCDAPESCSGASKDCPADAAAPAGPLCRASVGPCDTEERCDGTRVYCPYDKLEPSTTVCRPAAGLCDAPEHCRGWQADCPPDALQPAGYVCRPKRSECDFEEKCPGGGIDCPADLTVADGTSCSDQNKCTTGDVCAGGNCVGAPLECPAPTDDCHGVACDPATGVCSNPALADGSDCSGGWCQAGVCVPRPDASMPDASMPQDASEGSADAEAQTTDDAQVHADAAVVSAEDAALQAFDAATVSVDAGVLAPEDAAVQTADAALLALDASTSATQPMGCGCAATNRSRAGWLGLVLGLGLLRRRGRLQG